MTPKIVAAPLHQPVIVTRPNPAVFNTRPTVMTPFGPVPLITNIPVVRQPPPPRYRPSPYARALGPGPVIEEIIEEYPDTFRNRDRDTYSDIDFDLDNISGTFGRRSVSRSRRHSFHGTGSRRSRRSSRRRAPVSSVMMDDPYDLGPDYTVVEERAYFLY